MWGPRQHSLCVSNINAFEELRAEVLSSVQTFIMHHSRTHANSRKAWQSMELSREISDHSEGGYYMHIIFASKEDAAFFRTHLPNYYTEWEKFYHNPRKSFHVEWSRRPRLIHAHHDNHTLAHNWQEQPSEHNLPPVMLRPSFLPPIQRYVPP